jgi:hypothetical protein
MISWRSLGLGLVLLAAGASCDDGTDISEFSYGASQPGAKLAEGGEIRHENVRILGMPIQTWVHVYQYTAPTSVPTAPFAAPADGGKGQFGNCVDERSGSPTWPFTPITGATYLDLPKVALSGPGITGSLNVVKTNPPNKAGNSTFRKYDFTYGGGAPGDIAGFNASMTTAAMSTPGGDYTLDIGKGEPMTYHMPEAYTAPLGIGGAAMVMIPAGKELEYSWTTPANDFGASGFEHTRKTYFNFTFFADPTSTNPPQFICFPDRDGHQIIPKAVIDALPAEGLIVNANLGHYMEAREAAPGEQRRFDLVTIFCNISAYKKQ